MHLSRSKLHLLTVQAAGHTVTKTTHLLLILQPGSPSSWSFSSSPDHWVLVSPSTSHTCAFQRCSLAILHSPSEEPCRLTHLSPKHVQGLVLTSAKICLIPFRHFNLSLAYNINRKTNFSQNDEIVNIISEDLLCRSVLSFMLPFLLGNLINKNSPNQQTQCKLNKRQEAPLLVGSK